MKKLFYFLPLILLAVSACNSEVCRDCPGITFNYEAVDPTINDEAMVFTRTDGSTVTFTRARFDETEGVTICSRNVDDPIDIPCDGVAEVQLISEDIGIDMAINFLELIGQRGVPTQVIQSFSFKARTFSQFQRTHAVVLEPQVVLEEGVVELRDTITLDGQLYEDVLVLIQPVDAFDGLIDLPEAGRFTSIIVKEGVGLLRLVDVNGNVYVRDFN